MSASDGGSSSTRVATSTVMLARVLGSSIGVAIVGSIFTSRLLGQVEEELPGFPAADVQGDPGRVAALADDVRTTIVDAFASGLADAFRAAVPIMVVGIVLVAALPGRRLVALMRERAAGAPSAEGTAHVM